MASVPPTSRSRPAISDRTLSLPLSPKVTDADQDDVVRALTEVFAAMMAR